MSLTLLALGSPDPRHARDVTSLAARLALSGVRTEVAFLDHGQPSPTAAARSLVGSGVTATALVPLLLSPAYHVRVDVPAAVATMLSAAPGLGIVPTEPIGLHPLVLEGVAELAEASGLPIGPRTGVIVAGSGSHDARAVAATQALVRTHGTALAERLGARAVRTAFLDGGRPLGRIRTLMRCVDGCTSFVVVALVVADGRVRDRLVTAAARHDLPMAPGTLCDTRALADLVVLRAAAVSAPRRPAIQHRPVGRREPVPPRAAVANREAEGRREPAARPA